MITVILCLFARSDIYRKVILFAIEHQMAILLSPSQCCLLNSLDGASILQSICSFHYHLVLVLNGFVQSNKPFSRLPSVFLLSVTRWCHFLFSNGSGLHFILISKLLKLRLELISVRLNQFLRFKVIMLPKYQALRS